MIFYMLAILVCSSPGDCHWQRKGMFRHEQACHDAGRGFMLHKAAKGYRCVIQAGI